LNSQPASCKSNALATGYQLTKSPMGVNNMLTNIRV